ncbi:MAG: ADOP family duplicated permease, partial [Vicinamibacterales bacterium]
ADACYRVCLFAFPRAFRDRHGAAMTAEFARQRAAIGRRPLALVRLWIRAAGDALWHGMSVRREAPSRGAPARSSRTGRAGWPSVRLEAWWHDLRYGARSLRRTPGLSLAVVLILTLGISANVVMFGTIDQLLLRAPAGIGHPENVRRVYFGSETERPGADRGAPSNSYRFVAAVRDEVPAFRAAAAMHAHAVTIGGGRDARPGRLVLVDAAYFPLLELRPAVGRFFTGDEAASNEPVVVLSHAAWRQQFAADESVIGRSIAVEGRRMTVIGVGPAEFSGLDDQPVDGWAPIGTLAPALLPADWATTPGWYAFGLVVRLAPGVADSVADEQGTAAYRRATATLEMPGQDGTVFTTPLTRLASPNGVGSVGQVGLWLLAVSVIVLTVAVANVAGLLLTRTLSRRPEIALRLALGVSRGRLVRQLLVESALLAALAAGVALAVAWLGGRFVQQVLLPGFAWRAAVVDGRVLGVVLVVGLATAFGAGLIPAFQALSTDFGAGVRTRLRGDSRHSGRLRSGLVLAQLALCVMLLVGAGLFTRSLIAVTGFDVGMDLEHVIQVRIPARPGASRAEVEASYAAARERIDALGGTVRTTITRGSAPMGGASAFTVMRDGWDRSQLRGRPSPAYVAIEPGFFETIGASLDRGRGVTVEDVSGHERVVVVNRALASAFWPGEDPIGSCLHFGISTNGPCTRVVGIVENTLLFSRDRVTNDSPQMYVPFTHPEIDESEPRALLVRARSDPAPLVRAVRSAMQSLQPDMPFVPVETMAALTSPQLQPWRLGTIMLMLFGGIALVIAAVGLYSAMAHAVAQRTHEIGVRLALGASRGHVAAQIGRRAVVTLAVGLGLGLLAAAAAAPSIAGLLYDTSPRDPVVYLTAAAVLAMAGLAAALVPIRRSAAIDPLRVLRAE